MSSGEAELQKTISIAKKQLEAGLTKQAIKTLTITPDKSEKPIQTCKNGHPMTADNTYTHPGSGNRECRECRRLSTKKPRGGRPTTAQNLEQWRQFGVALAQKLGSIDVANHINASATCLNRLLTNQ